MWGYAIALVACSVDDRQVGASDEETAAVQPEAGGSSACGNGVECPAVPPLAAPGAACFADAECSALAPACLGSVCACALSASELAVDPENCGACGNDCSSETTGADCQQGRCVRPGEPAPSSITRSSSGRQAVLSLTAAHGVVLQTERYSLQLSAGQAPGGNAVHESSRYRLEGGLIGASQ